MKYMRTLNTVLVVMLVGVLFTFSTPAAAANATVSVDTVTSVRQGDNFTASIRIADVIDFDAAQYDITYNPAVIRVTDVTNGDINGTVIPVNDTWGYVPADTQGTIRILNNVKDLAGVSGSGYLAEIHFHAVGAGTSAIDLIDLNGKCILGDINANQILGVTWTDGSVQVIASGSGSGGGGGGGGGSTGITSLTEYTTSSGEFVVDATAESSDGKVKLYIPRGTTGKNRTGQRLRFVSIKENSADTLPPTDQTFVCLTYDIGPEGATFDKPIYLTFNYSDSEIPAGVAEEDLVIATWQDEKWIEFEGCVIEPVNNTITVQINHLTVFTVIAHIAPASFEVTKMNITPTEVYRGETVTVSASITNTGDLSGSYNVTLRINDLKLQTKNVTVGGGDSQTISFTVTPDIIGEYTVEVNGLLSKFKVIKPVPEGTVAEISVPTPASFTISDLSITPDEVNPSEEVTISAMVTNTGGSDGSYTVVLKIDDKEEARKEISLSPGKSEKVSFNATKDIAGSYTIDINGHAGQFTVKSPPPVTNPVNILPVQPSTNWWPIIIIFTGLFFLSGVLFILYKRLT